tara:strand:- start:1300 stop:1905 length:606 start_codon:yes stop_codon:yes gene_type:complete
MTLLFAKNNSLSAITELPSAISGGGALNLISTQTASSSSTIDFTSGIDSTYKEYIFKFIDIHPSTDGALFNINFRDGGSSFDATKTTTQFRGYHNEGGSDTSLAYESGRDLAQSTGVQTIGADSGNDNDQCTSGTLQLFDPSSTTFVKHFLARLSVAHQSDYIIDVFTAGYCNVTAAIDGVQFSMSSGNIDAGTIKLYGVT